MKSPEWTREEVETLIFLYEHGGDKVCLPFHEIEFGVNQAHGNGRTEAACKRRIYRFYKDGGRFPGDPANAQAVRAGGNPQ